MEICHMFTSTRPGGETVEYPDPASVEARVNMLQNEMEAWRSEAERLKSKVNESEAKHRRLLNKVKQVHITMSYIK